MEALIHIYVPYIFLLLKHDETITLLCTAHIILAFTFNKELIYLRKGLILSKLWLYNKHWAYPQNIQFESEAFSNLPTRGQPEKSETQT